MTRPVGQVKSQSMELPALASTPLFVRDLSLMRGAVTLIRDLEFVVQPGEALILLGRNGVGKTTLLRALAGVLRPESGDIRYGADSAEHAAATRCAFLGHENALKPDETPRQSLEFWSRLSGVKGQIPVALDQFGLKPLADRPARRMSQGQKRRAALARLYLLNRPVWLLDEPAAPLDVDGRARLAHAVNQHRQRGGVVVAATHQPLDWDGARIQELVR